jgi:hypothetical protein
MHIRIPHPHDKDAVFHPEHCPGYAIAISKQNLVSRCINGTENTSQKAEECH